MCDTDNLAIFCVNEQKTSNAIEWVLRASDASTQEPPIPYLYRPKSSAKAGLQRITARDRSGYRYPEQDKCLYRDRASG